jgi:outer membrane protein assembly factor BamA
MIRSARGCALRQLIAGAIALAAVHAAIGVGPAIAQAVPLPAPPPVAQPVPPPPATPLGATATGGCSKRSKPSLAASPGIAPPAVTWSEFDITGELRDPPDVVRALFAPVMTRRSSLTEDARADVVATAAKLGYFVVNLSTRDAANGSHAVLELAPLPLVRNVNIDIKQSLFTTALDDQVRRRMRIRPGTYLPWRPADRACELDEEQARIADYLHIEEGFFDATVEHREARSGDGLEITIKVGLGGDYRTGRIRIANRDAVTSTIDEAEIIKQFEHDCVLCLGAARFTRAGHLEDIQRVVVLFQKRGFPEVRVHTSFEQEPQTAFNRRTHAVDFTVTIEPHRRIDTVFEGNDPDAAPEDQLRDQLTFSSAASSDDLEASNSARALVGYFQSRGWFDAHVTWIRERLPTFDRIRFRIEQGRQRPVREIRFVGNTALKDEQLEAVIGTTPEKLTTSLFGGNTNATASQLAADVDRIAQIYRSSGYRDVRVSVEAATSPAAFGSAALTAALAAADRGDGLYVRYVISEGEPTLVARIEVALPAATGAPRGASDRALCGVVLADLTDLLGTAPLAPRPDAPGCVAELGDVKFREDAAAQTKDQLKTRLFSHGRPRAEVGYEVTEIAPHRVAIKYTLASIQTLQIGKVVIRGNFKTRPSIILGELNLREGALLTQDALADGARKLRNTGLFDAVNPVMPDLDTTATGEVNVVIEVVERSDFLVQIDAEFGYSSYNGAFLKLIPSFKNLLGLGLSFDVAVTVGGLENLLDPSQQFDQLSAESTLRVPSWLSRRFSPVEFETDITAFHRRQKTPQFGFVTTDGATLTLSRTWERKRVGTRNPRAITTGLHYDFRLRERPIDALRPVGADDDQTQVPISTRTGSLGATFEWEQRVDSQHVLSTLAPEAGFRFEAQVSIASQYLGGQDTFLKLSTAGSKYWSTFSGDLVLRGDLRYDQGIPLGGAVLLPEVERFFAGGDSTVRGYDDGRLATEIIQVPVAPIGSVQQIRILPAGGNIRAMSSIDAQLRVYKIAGVGFLASGLFVDAGMIANQWSTVVIDDIRPSIGMALGRFVLPFGAFAVEYAIPLRLQLGDDPRGRWHISFAARAQF